MDSSNRKNKIIWAVDPTQDPAQSKNLVKELKIWAKHLDCDVLPVAMFSKSLFNIAAEMAFAPEERLEEVARNSLNRYLKKANARNFLNPELIFVDARSTRKMASEMAKYAEKQKPLFIFANTRAKKSWSPFRLGGFVETLVATSSVPVFLLNPSSVTSTKFKSILFPTDFHTESKNALMRLKPLARAFNSKVILYNQVEAPNIYASEASGIWPAQGVTLETMIKDIETDRLKKANNWLNLLRADHISCSALIRRQEKYIGEEIIAAAKKNKVGLIAIASHSGTVSQTILGGVARDVLLQAKCPVLIFYRPKAVRSHKVQPKTTVSEKYIDQKESEVWVSD